jgi:5-hydroxyisourate hydrolase
MKGVSIHVVDVAHGRVARGMRCELSREVAPGRWQDIATGAVGDNGVLEGLAGRESLFPVGLYELRLHVADYYRALGTALPEPPFMTVQVFRFGVATTDQHYHLPVKLTPWGLSCFRGA